MGGGSSLVTSSFSTLRQRPGGCSSPGQIFRPPLTVVDTKTAVVKLAYTAQQHNSDFAAKLDCRDVWLLIQLTYNHKQERKLPVCV